MDVKDAKEYSNSKGGGVNKVFFLCELNIGYSAVGWGQQKIVIRGYFAMRVANARHQIRIRNKQNSARPRSQLNGTANKHAAIIASTARGKTATCGQPYFVSGILIDDMIAVIRCTIKGLRSATLW
ncbi:MAG: hypothetical protein ACYS71_01520 [Planctomycetota bacterium]|jgi:hypothetical protein